MFVYDTSVRLHDTDAAGLLFFGAQFRLAHDAYESYMESVGFDFSRILGDLDFLLAIVHAEADFKRTLYVGDKLRIELTVGAIGDSSYTLLYHILAKDGDTAGTARTVHVCIDKETRAKKTLPEGLRVELEKLLQ